MLSHSHILAEHTRCYNFQTVIQFFFSCSVLKKVRLMLKRLPTAIVGLLLPDQLVLPELTDIQGCLTSRRSHPNFSSLSSFGPSHSPILLHSVRSPFAKLLRTFDYGNNQTTKGGKTGFALKLTLGMHRRNVYESIEQCITRPPALVIMSEPQEDS